MTDYEARLTEQQRKCNDAADAAAAVVRGNHAKDYNQFTEYWPGKRGFVTCMCGTTFRRPQALGQHIAAVEKRVDKVWDETWVETWNTLETRVTA